jgi:hypothetical protein
VIDDDDVPVLIVGGSLVFARSYGTGPQGAVSSGPAASSPGGAAQAFADRERVLRETFARVLARA